MQLAALVKKQPPRYAFMSLYGDAGPHMLSFQSCSMVLNYSSFVAQRYNFTNMYVGVFVS